MAAYDAVCLLRTRNLRKRVHPCFGEPDKEFLRLHFTTFLQSSFLCGVGMMMITTTRNSPPFSSIPIIIHSCVYHLINGFIGISFRCDCGCGGSLM
ncbi:hypothetical protein GBA52_027883 [Prunus armeniaca]|nr:hypothetical protein GBA52_027883 [Prunus armeniaca]